MHDHSWVDFMNFPEKKDLITLTELHYLNPSGYHRVLSEIMPKGLKRSCQRIEWYSYNAIQIAVMLLCSVDFLLYL